MNISRRWLYFLAKEGRTGAIKGEINSFRRSGSVITFYIDNSDPFEEDKATTNNSAICGGWFDAGKNMAVCQRFCNIDFELKMIATLWMYIKVCNMDWWEYRLHYTL